MSTAAVHETTNRGRLYCSIFVGMSGLVTGEANNEARKVASAVGRAEECRPRDGTKGSNMAFYVCIVDVVAQF